MRTGAVVTASLAAATGVALVPGTAGALPGFEFDRIAGGDRYATAADLATTAFPAGATDALLATGEAFPDALAGNYLAGALGAPILLAHHDDVPQVTMDALDDLSVDTVTLLGGTGALDDGVAAELTGAGYTVDRISGINRFDTARLIAVQGATSGIGSVDGHETAIVTTGENFPDALAVGPVAYDESFPVLLTTPGALSVPAAQAIDDLNVEHVIILGGTDAISTATENTIGAMGVTTERIEGANRFSTATAIADRAVADFGFGVTHVNVAFGRNFPDALAGGPLGAVEHAATLLTDSDEASSETCSWLSENAGTLVDGHALGGTNAIGAAVLGELRECAGGEAPNEAPRANQDFNSTPSTPQLSELGTDGIARQVYTFSDITPGHLVDITFVPCFAESVSSTGAVAFADDPFPGDPFHANLILDDDKTLPPFVGAFPNNRYLGVSHAQFLGMPVPVTARILFVDGELPGGALGVNYVDDYPVGPTGSVEVEFISNEGDCVIPVVFDDIDGDDTLDLTPDTNLPVDDFAVGGAFIATNGEAADGQSIAGLVMFNNPAEGYVVLDDAITPTVDGNVFYYDANDGFSLVGNWAGVPPEIGGFFPPGVYNVTHEQFQTFVSPFDVLAPVAPTDSYSRTAPSDFNIAGDFAGTATGVTVTMGDFDDNPADGTSANDAKVTWTTPDPIDGRIVDYQVYAYDVVTGIPMALGYDGEDDPLGSIPQPNQDTDNDQIDDDVDNQVIIEDLAAGDYQFVVTALTATGMLGLFNSEPSAPATSVGAPGAPRSTSITFNDNAPLGQISNTDQIDITFDIPMDAPNAGDSITVVDADGTVSTWVNGTNATFSLLPGNVLRVVPTASGVVVAGGDSIQGPPSTVVGSSGVTATVGLSQLEWNTVDSPDNTIG